MPTNLRGEGDRIGFCSSGSDEPAHVHVHRSGNDAKFRLAPVQLSGNNGFREVELREIVLILQRHEIMQLEAWNETE